MKVSGGGVYSADGTSIALTAGQFSSIDPRPVRTTADLPSISGTQSTGLSVPLKANTNYFFEVWLWHLQGVATGTTYSVHSLAAGAALVVAAQDGDSNTSAFQAAPIPVNATGAKFAQPNLGNTAQSMMHVWGIITVGINATTLQIDSTDTGTTQVLKAGSVLKVSVIA